MSLCTPSLTKLQIANGRVSSSTRTHGGRLDAYLITRMRVCERDGKRKETKNAAAHPHLHTYQLEKPICMIRLNIFHASLFSITWCFVAATIAGMCVYVHGTSWWSGAEMGGWCQRHRLRPHLEPSLHVHRISSCVPQRGGKKHIRLANKHTLSVYHAIINIFFHNYALTKIYFLS